jgi:hypothetical protein
LSLVELVVHVKVVEEELVVTALLLALRVAVLLQSLP